MKNIVSMLMMNNATSSLGAGDITNIFGLLLIVAVAMVIVVVLINLAYSIDSFRRFKKILKFISSSIGYAVYGLLTFIVIGGPCVIAYYTFMIASENASGSLEILKWIGIIGGIYIVMTLVGYVTKKRIWKRIASFIEEDKEEEPREKLA